MKFWKFKQHKHGFEAYEASVKSIHKSKRPIQEQKFIVVDTETTGLDVKSDVILSIGIVPIMDYQIDIQNTHEWFVTYTGDKSGGHHIHEILGRDSASGESPEQVAVKLLYAFEGAVIIGHHIQFDALMLNKFVEEHVGQSLLNPTYDTYRLYKRLYGDLPNVGIGNSLDTICEELEIQIHDRHTALGDASATALLFMRLLKRLEKRGVRTTAELLRR